MNESAEHTSNHPIRPNHARVPPQLRIMRWGFTTFGEVVPGLMARMAYRLWFQTRRFPMSSHEDQLLEWAKHVSLHWNGKRVAVFIWGAGPTLLLVHGWHSRGTDLGAFVDPLVSAGYRVVTFDAPGHGQSPGRRTTFFEIADVIDTLAQTFGPLHGIVTHSFGTPCATFVLHNGLRINRIVCLSPPAHFDSLLSTFSQRLQLPDRVTRKLMDMLERDFGTDLGERVSTDTHVKKLSSIPALIIHDRDDRTIPWEEGEAVAKAWPNARLVLTKGLGHRRILADSEVVRKTVDFMMGGSRKGSNPQ